MANLKELFDKTIDVVNQVEEKANAIKVDPNQENLTSEQKKEMAVQLLLACTDIPMLPKFVEAKIYAAVIDLMIDLCVYLHNKFEIFKHDKEVAAEAKAEPVAEPVVETAEVEKEAEAVAEVPEAETKAEEETAGDVAPAEETK